MATPELNPQINLHWGSIDDGPQNWLRAYLAGWGGGGVAYGGTNSPSLPTELRPEGWELQLDVADRNVGDHNVLFTGPHDDRGPIAVAYVKRAGQSGRLFCTVAVRLGGHETARVILDSILGKARPASTPPVDAVDVDFWSTSAHGAQSRRRRIAAPSWADVEANYPQGTRPLLRDLASLRHGQLDAGMGRLAILHGPPGTGKTNLIRAIAREWRPWCDVHYVVDPEAFFGDANYMLSVLLSGNDGSPYVYSDDDDVVLEDTTGFELKEDDRWRLVVVEDADEFLRTDGKDRIGQALSRLLNLGDGLVGQGLKVVVLLTTNVRLGELNPAITRPGRCLANVEVPPFPSGEAVGWLRDHDAGDLAVPGAGLTLAELYERTRQVGKIGDEPAAVTAGQYL